MTRTILDWLYVTRLIPWVVTAVIGVLMLGPGAYDEVRFFLRPVAVMQGELVEKNDEYLRVHISGEKIRGVECRYLGIAAFGDRAVGLPVDLIIDRVDMPAPVRTRPPGLVDVGVWELRPVFGVTSVRVYTTHDCEGTLRPTKVAEVNL